MRRLVVVLTSASGALWPLSVRMLGAQYSSPWLLGVVAGALLAVGCYAVVSHAVGRAPYQGGDPSGDPLGRALGARVYRNAYRIGVGVALLAIVAPPLGTGSLIFSIALVLGSLPTTILAWSAPDT